MLSCCFWHNIECECTSFFLCQKNLWNAWVSISELRHSVTLKRIKLLLLRQKLKLASILRGQVRMLTLSIKFCFFSFYFFEKEVTNYSVEFSVVMIPSCCSKKTKFWIYKLNYCRMVTGLANESGL